MDDSLKSSGDFALVLNVLVGRSGLENRSRDITISGGNAQDGLQRGSLQF
jgi:hypothetical protein